MKTKTLLLALAFGSLLTAASCSKDDKDKENTAATDMSLSVHLTDGPADYDAVYIDVREVQVNVDGASWVTLPLIHPGIYDLLHFRNGLDTLLCRQNIPAGSISQMRLILGDNNSVVVDGDTRALTTPSAQESGLKINLNETFVAGGAYDIWIDFDAGKSIHETGNGKMMLKPVMRAYSALTNGQVTGYIAPFYPCVVYITDGTDTYTALPAVDGYFKFSGLPNGTYTVTVDYIDPLHGDVVINNVVVSYGVVTNLNTIVP